MDLPCDRCGRRTSATLAGGELTIHPHNCDRYLAAHLIDRDGEPIAVWTSEDPGRTGPSDLVLGGGSRVGHVTPSLRGSGAVWLHEWVPS